MVNICTRWVVAIKSDVVGVLEPGRTLIFQLNAPGMSLLSNLKRLVKFFNQNTYILTDFLHKSDATGG
jgi:hypothetical protein